jgi:hypothetical protein
MARLEEDGLGCKRPKGRTQGQLFEALNQATLAQPRSRTTDADFDRSITQTSPAAEIANTEPHIARFARSPSADRTHHHPSFHGRAGHHNANARIAKHAST